jgi:hypothetical protein
MICTLLYISLHIITIPTMHGLVLTSTSYGFISIIPYDTKMSLSPHFVTFLWYDIVYHVFVIVNNDTNMTDSWLSRCFSSGDIESLLYLSNWHTGSVYDPICHVIYIFHTYIDIFHSWWITCDIQDRHRRPIHRISSTKRYILISDITVPIGVLMDSYGCIDITNKITSFIYPGVYVTWLWLGRLTLSPTNEERYWQPSLWGDLTFARVGNFYDLISL